MQPRSRRTGPSGLHLTLSNDGSRWVWSDIPVDAHTVHIGFPLDRLGPQPPLAAFIVFMGGLALVLVTALLLVRRLIQPLEKLSVAAGKAFSGCTASRVRHHARTDPCHRIY